MPLGLCLLTPIPTSSCRVLSGAVADHTVLDSISLGPVHDNMQRCCQSITCDISTLRHIMLMAWCNRLSICGASLLISLKALTDAPHYQWHLKLPNVLRISTTMAALRRTFGPEDLGLGAGPSSFKPCHDLMLHAATGIPSSVDTLPVRSRRCLVCCAPQAPRCQGPLLDAEFPGRDAVFFLQKAFALSFSVIHDDSRARAYSLRTLGLAKCCGPTFPLWSLLWQLRARLAALILCLSGHTLCAAMQFNDHLAKQSYVACFPKAFCAQTTCQ